MASISPRGTPSSDVTGTEEAVADDGFDSPRRRPTGRSYNLDDLGKYSMTWGKLARLCELAATTACQYTVPTFGGSSCTSAPLLGGRRVSNKDKHRKRDRS